MAGMDNVMLPRLGGHVHLWGLGHSCDTPEGHDGGCVCECGLPAPGEVPAE